jgi:hypothetical protein
MAFMCARAGNSIVSKPQSSTNPCASVCGWDPVAPFAFCPITQPAPSIAGNISKQGSGLRIAHVSLSLSISHTFSKYSGFIYFNMACRQLDPTRLGRFIV